MKCKNCKNLVKRIDGDGTLYDFCGMVIDSPDSEIERDCKYYAVATNADRIRAMSNKELAMWIHQTRHNPLDDRTLFEWLDWLKQEAES